MSNVVVITGSTRGIGAGLARAFLERSCEVVISGRTDAGVDAACEAMQQAAPQGALLGVVCDVRKHEQVQQLWGRAADMFGKVDIWINNAGIAHAQMPVHTYPPGLISSVVDTNIVGVVNGAQVAIQGMLSQGHGSLYNMHGLGSDGRKLEGLALYGTTKYGIRYLTDSLIRELKESAVRVGSINPGMVVTDLLTAQYVEKPEEWQRAQRIFNLLADRVETVAPWLADQILSNERHGTAIRWLTTGKIVKRFILAPFVRRNVVGDVTP